MGGVDVPGIIYAGYEDLQRGEGHLVDLTWCALMVVVADSEVGRAIVFSLFSGAASFAACDWR